MNLSYNYKQCAILYVDDEETALKHFSRLFEDRFRIYTAGTAQEGLALLEEKRSEIGLLLTDQRMPGEKGVWLLEKARQLEPRIIRILVTAYADMNSAIAAVNTGSIYKYITKPWSEPDMENAIKRGLEFHLVQRERDQLLHEKLSVLRNMMMADRIVSLGLLAAGLSHHIRNSLVAVKTFLDLAPAKLEDEKSEMAGLRDPDFWKDYHQNAQGQIHKINNLLKELWSASESQSKQFADKVALAGVVREIAERMRPDFERKQITLETEIPADFPELQVDKGKFYRLFELLFRDELVSLPNGSRIQLSAAGADASGEVQIVLADNGAGLPKEALRLVFDPFSVRSDSPAEYGINMMACFFIVHHHGGRIEAQSEDGRGTKFTIHLPLNPERQPAMTSEDDFLQKVHWSDALWEKLLKSE
jgi:two-component system probable response regulator PhcQ